MNKQFKSNPKHKWLLFLFPVIPFIPMLFGEPFDYQVIMHLVTYSLVAFAIYFNLNRTVAEIKDSKIHF